VGYKELIRLKKLTIGSMKEMKSQMVLTKDESAKKAEFVATVETNRKMEIEQNHIHYQVEMKSDQSILEAALEQGIELDYKCQKGTCGRCKVKVINGRSLLQSANSLEENKLVQLLKMGFRLACQARAK
jgi:ferredoxin